MPLFTVPKEAKEFWGAEYLNPKGTLSLSSAMLRIETYVRVHGLVSEDGQSFKLDDVLKRIFSTDKPQATYNDLCSLLAPHAISL